MCNGRRKWDMQSCGAVVVSLCFGVVDDEDERDESLRSAL